MFVLVFVASGGNSTWCGWLFFERFHKNENPQG
ncbi:Uncharacterised protein [Escherichia coli]|nr:Uncharacterised protein [Escherichia coli]CAD5853764.1 Uncharacterised protein [Escherichia coli]CAD6115310.1 Uncharacterised protein [Escherichia coli]